MQLSSQANKGLAIGLAISMVLWSVSFLTVPLVFAAPNGDNCLINEGGTVFLINSGVKRGFTSGPVFESHGYNFGQVIAANSDDASLTTGAIMVYRDGSLVKGPSDPLVYLVANGQKRGFVSGDVFTGLGYSFANVVSAAANTFADLPTGANMESATERHPAGTLVNSSGTIWKMTATGRMGVASMSDFNSHGYNLGRVVAANSADLAATNEGLLEARGTCASSSTTPPVSGNVSVSLSSSSPAASTVVAGQAAAHLANFTFTGNGTVTNLVLKRTGVSADSTLASVFLYDGVQRLSDGASVSSGNVTFNDSTGLFTVSGSKVISVKSNIAASTSGQTLGVQVSSTTLTSGTATGTPSGAIHTVASATLAGVDFNSTTTPAAATISPQDEYTMWQNVVSVTTRKVLMKEFRVRQVGSVNNEDLGNFRLYVDGTQVGSAVAVLDSKGFVNFDLGSGVELQTGSRTVKMIGDIVGGSNRNFSFSLRQSVDGIFEDTEFNQTVLPTANSSTFSARSTGTQTIDTGTLTFTKATDSPSGNVVISGSSVTLAKFDVKAAGERMKVESLQVRVEDDDGDTAFTLRNGALFVDGVQVGSTAALAGDTDSTQAYTEYTFGSSFIVDPKKDAVLEVRADIFDNDGTNDVADADTLQVEIVAGSSNVQRLTSLGFASSPAAVVEANTLTVATGSLTVAKDVAYADHTIVAPKTAYKIGSYNVQATTTEGASITSVVVDFDEVADAFDASDDLTDLFLKIGSSYTSPIKATVTDTANTYNTNVAITAGQTIKVEVYATVASSATDGDGTADTFESSITLSYTTTGSSTSATASEVDGQTLTAGAGTFTTALDGSSALNRIVAGNQEVEAAKYKITVTNDTYTVTEIQVKVGSAAIAGTIQEFRLYDGTTLLGTATFSQATNTAALITGLNISVPANTNKVLTGKLLLGQIGTGFGASQSDAKLTLDSVKHKNSNGTEATDTNDRAGNEMYVYKSIPTVSQVDLTNATLVNGSAKDVYKFTVSANSSGPVALKQFVLTTTWSDGGTADTLELESVKLFEDGVDVTSNVTIQDEDGNSVESTSGLLESDQDLVVSWDVDKESVVPAGGTKTYTVRATPQGFRTTGADTVGDSVSLFLDTDSAHNGTSVFLNGTGVGTIWELHTAAAAAASGGAALEDELTWSDNSSNAHVPDEDADSTGDWANGYKVLNLALDGETWTK